MAMTARALAQEPATTSASIETRCTNAQAYLNNTQRPRDLRARVDRLQAYRYIHQRLNSFVSRLERNNQPNAAELRAQLDTLNTTIEQFKIDYEAYDQARDQAAKIKNCQQQYQVFIQKLIDARNKRAAVNQDIEKIQTLLGVEVKNQFDQLYQELLVTGNTGGLNE